MFRKRITRYIIFSLVAALCLIGAHIAYLYSLSAKEHYPDDTFLSAVKEKKALIIVAHDDDMAGSSGTISRLCSDGWMIREMCFYQQDGIYREKDSLKNPVRKASLKEAARIQGLDGVDPVDFNFRLDHDNPASYLPMPYSRFRENFNIDSLYGYISAYIQPYRPAVIFTLDDVTGGYGHPDHVLISKLVLKYCLQHRNDPGFSVKRIYQPVFPPSLAESVLGRMPAYMEAKKQYQCEGMPLPDVQVDIVSYAKQKNKVMKAYVTEQNSLRKIWPYYNWYPSWLYFRIFNRDFFRVIDILKLNGNGTSGF